MPFSFLCLQAVQSNQVFMCIYFDISENFMAVHTHVISMQDRTLLSTLHNAIRGQQSTFKNILHFHTYETLGQWSY